LNTDLKAISGGKKATRAPSTDVVEGLERALIGKLMLDIGMVPSVLEVLEPGDLSPARRPVFDVLIAQHAQGFPFLLPSVVADLDQAGKLELAGGKVEVATLFDSEATAADIGDVARRLRILSLESSSRIIAEQIATGNTKPETHAELQAIHDQLKALNVGALDLADMGFSGSRLEALRKRPPRESPFPGLLPPEPGLVLLNARPKTGKSTLAGFIAQAWACGVSPWERAPALPGSRAFVVSAEQPVERIDATLRRMDTNHEGLTREKWTHRVTILARDPELSKSAARMFTLDGDGRALLRQGLLRAKRDGDPYGLVVLDSLSRLAPEGLDENSNMEITAFLAPLQELAEELSVYIILIHHVGHGIERKQARSAGRGASSMAAVAQGVWLLDNAPNNPRQRTLHVQGNAISERWLVFDVSGEENEPGDILFWRIGDPLACYEIGELLAYGETISTNALAWRLQGEEPKKGGSPSSPHQRASKELRERWERDGLIEVVKGDHGAKALRRLGSENTTPAAF